MRTALLLEVAALLGAASCAPGKAYYYVRAFQRDPENPGGDPEIAWSSPFFVTYR